MICIIEYFPENISVSLSFLKLLNCPASITPSELDLVIDAFQMVLFLVKDILAVGDLELDANFSARQPLRFVSSIRDFDLYVSLNGPAFLWCFCNFLKALCRCFCNLLETPLCL